MEDDANPMAFDDDDMKLLSQMHEYRSITNERAYSKTWRGRNLTNEPITLSDVPILLRLIHKASTGGGDLASYSAALPEQDIKPLLMRRRALRDLSSFRLKGTKGTGAGRVLHHQAV